MTTFSYSGAALSNLVGNTPGANVSNLVTLLNDLKTFLNAPNLDGTNIADIPESLLTLATQQKLGLNDGAQIGRGKSIIPGTEARTNTAYGTLTTPDQVTGVVLPTDGLIAVAYQAQWFQSNANAAKAAIFIGANQLKISVDTSTNAAVQETSVFAPVSVATNLSTFEAGLVTGAAGAALAAYPTTGVAVGVQTSPSFFGGPCYIWAAAGTYTVSVQFKASAGSVSAADRRLWVWTMGF